MPRLKRRYRQAASAVCPMPNGVTVFNGCNEPCDVLVGPCSCGGWHGRVQMLELCRQKGIATEYLERAFEAAIRRNHKRLVEDGLKRGVASIVRDYGKSKG